jgi:hypothetical protein
LSFLDFCCSFNAKYELVPETEYSRGFSTTLASVSVIFGAASNLKLSHVKTTDIINMAMKAFLNSIWSFLVVPLLFSRQTYEAFDEVDAVDDGTKK